MPTGVGVLTMNRSRQVDPFERAGNASAEGAAALLFLAGLMIAVGCETPSAHTFSRDYSLRPDLPVDPPGAWE